MKYTIICSIALITFLHIIRLQIINQLNTEDTNYNAIKVRTLEVKRENVQLYEELIEIEALVTIEMEARKEGFVSAKYIYLP